jgi:hypothetical protein
MVRVFLNEPGGRPRRHFGKIISGLGEMCGVEIETTTKPHQKNIVPKSMLRRACRRPRPSWSETSWSSRVAMLTKIRWRLPSAVIWDFPNRNHRERESSIASSTDEALSLHVRSGARKIA